MGKVVVFSPVGGTDPISWSNGREGALLQTCRHYRPDIVYLYMSAEILENHHKDNRYMFCLKKLEESIGKEIEIRIIERPDLHEVQEFNYFYQDFYDLLQKISEELDKADDLILNVSSGTPAMKSTLMVLSSLTRMRCRLVQVITPDKKMNEHIHPVGSEADIEALWELNDDNDPEKYVDRTQEISCPWLIADQKKRLIKDHVLAYDYEAALAVHAQMPLNADGSYVKMLEAAAQRKQLNNLEMVKILKEIGEEKNDAFRPIKNDEMRMLFEYILTLDIRQKRGEYGDFVRAITPPITDLFMKVLEKYGSINISDYYEFNDEHKKRWKLELIKGTSVETIMSRHLDWNNEQKKYVLKQGYTYKKEKIDRYIHSTQLLNLIFMYVPGTEDILIRLCEKLRYVEDNIRNRVAHEMVGVSDDFIQAKVGYNSADIVKIFQKILYMLDGGTKKNWDSYDKMNTYILSCMEEQLK